jgi:Fur family transcriptional regulator, iron response regulator
VLEAPPAPSPRNVDLLAVLRTSFHRAGLRPTRQRLLLGWILFGAGGRHVTAETLFAEAKEANIAVSLATVYNTLHQFTRSGLLRQLVVHDSRSYFDTNVEDHHHFFHDDEHTLHDIPQGLSVTDAIDPPSGMQVVRVEVVVHVRRRQNDARQPAKPLPQIA